MVKNKKYVHRSYLPHQYEKEEEFLSEMAREGWHFIKLHYGFPLTKYEFEKGEPVDYIYQLDYVTKEEDTEDYHSLFADAGWEEMFSWNGVYDGQWYYFRRVRAGSKDDRIFTDTESKYLMYNKLWKKYGLFFLLMFSMELSSLRILIDNLADTPLPSISAFLDLFLLSMYIFLTVWYIYMIAGIILKKRQFKRKLASRI